MHGRGIRTARAFAGLTAKAVARTVGMSVWRLSRIERGRVAVREAELERLAEVLGVDPEWFGRPLVRSLDREVRVPDELEPDRN